MPRFLLNNNRQINVSQTENWFHEILLYGYLCIVLTPPLGNRFYLCFVSKAKLLLEVLKDCKKCVLEEFTNFGKISDFTLARLEGKQAHIYSLT